jgi:ferritin
MAEAPSRNLLRRTVAVALAAKPAVASVSSTKAPSTKGKNILLSDDCVEYLNYRVQQEEYSGRIYLAMSMWLDNNGYVNAAKLWRKYSNEEMSHSDLARTYLLSMGVQPETPVLESPEQTFTGLPEIIEMSYDHEIVVTQQIKELADDAMKKMDHMLYEFALAYLKEQVEEHNKMQNWVDQLNAFGTDKVAMRLLDHEMKDYL